jgi:hypothetical protein
MLSDNQVYSERRDYYTADGRYLGSEQVNPDGRYIVRDGSYVTRDGRYFSRDGRYLSMDDQFGWPPVVSQHHAKLHGGSWPGQAEE